MIENERTEIVRAGGPVALPSPWILGGLDLAQLSLVIRGTWVFDVELAPARLKEGLARVLALYPHLAGRMVRGREVVLDDSGVPFTTAADPTVSVDDLRTSRVPAGRFAPPLRMSRVRRGRAAPLAVRLTRLRDGSVLCLCCSHTCLDGAGFYGMVDIWSRICGGRPFSPPVLDQSLLPTASNRSKAEVVRAAVESGWRKVPLTGLLRLIPAFLLGHLHERAAPIHFGPEALLRLKSAANREAGRTDLSTNEALSSHLTRMCLRLHGIPDGTECHQVTVLDGRERLPGVPVAFAGNAAFVVNTAAFAAGASLGEVAAKTHAALEPIVAVPSAELLRRVVLGLDLVRYRMLMLPYDVSAVHGRRPSTIYVNSFSRMPVYEVDFGDAAHPTRPVLVIPHDLPDPVLVWPAPPAAGGLDAYLTGRAARALRRRQPGDAWWAELLQFDAA